MIQNSQFQRLPSMHTQTTNLQIRQHHKTTSQTHPKTQTHAKKKTRKNKKTRIHCDSFSPVLHGTSQELGIGALHIKLRATGGTKTRTPGSGPDSGPWGCGAAREARGFEDTFMVVVGGNILQETRTNKQETSSDFWWPLHGVCWVLHFSHF